MPTDINLTAELKTAKTVQQALLNTYHIQSKAFEIAKCCKPAHHLGGDFYFFSEKSSPITQENTPQDGVISFQRSNQHSIRLFIGDVAGHGISSALVMSLCCGLIPTILDDYPSPKECLYHLNNKLTQYLEGSQVPYLTVSYAQYDIDKKELTYARAGHPPAILLKKDGSIQHLESDGVFLGMYKDEIFPEHTLSFDPTDKLILYTDGIPETRASNQEFWGMPAFEDILSKNATKSCTELQKKIFSALNTHLDQPSHDDQTLLIFGHA